MFIQGTSCGQCQGGHFLAQPIGVAFPGQAKVLFLLGAEFGPREFFGMLDGLHAVLETGLHQRIGHLAECGDLDCQPLRRLLAGGELRQQPEGLVLVSLFPRLAEQGVEKLPLHGRHGTLSGALLELRAEEREPSLRADMALQHAGQHPAELVLDLPIGLGVPAAAEARGDLLPGLFSTAGSLAEIQFKSRCNWSTGSLPISSKQHPQGRLADAAALVRLAGSCTGP